MSVSRTVLRGQGSVTGLLLIYPLQHFAIHQYADVLVSNKLTFVTKTCPVVFKLFVDVPILHTTKVENVPSPAA